MTKIEHIRAFNRFYTKQIGLLDRIDLDGLSLTQARMIYEIGSDKSLNARELVGLLGKDEGYLSRVINSLNKSGLITRTPSHDDARINHLHLSSAGQKYYAHLIKMAGKAIENMIAPLPDATIDQMLGAMSTIEGILSWPPASDPQLREITTGDTGWIIKRHGELYAAHEGFDMTFEATVANIMAKFLETKDWPIEKGWIMEINGLRLGCVLVVADSSSIARLRLMLVEPFARGKGIGQTLVETAIHHAREQGFKKMVLWTQEGLDSACRLYERNGFLITDNKPNEIFGQKVVEQNWELTL